MKKTRAIRRNTLMDKIAEYINTHRSVELPDLLNHLYAIGYLTKENGSIYRGTTCNLLYYFRKMGWIEFDLKIKETIRLVNPIQRIRLKELKEKTKPK